MGVRIEKTRSRRVDSSELPYSFRFGDRVTSTSPYPKRVDKTTGFHTSPGETKVVWTDVQYNEQRRV